MTSDEKTLVILSPGFAKDEADTTCIPLQQSLVRAINAKHPSLRIIIIAFQYPYERKTYSWHGNTVMAEAGKNKGGLSKWKLRRRILHELKNIHAAHPVTGVLSFWYGECAWVGKRFSDKYEIRHFCWMWGQDARPGNKYPRNLRLKATELVALSDHLRHEFAKNYGIRPLHVIPPGIDIREFSSPVEDRDIDVVAAGSLIPLKQYEIFIDVIADIKETRPDIKALLIGDGPEKSKLQSRIEQLGLNSNVLLPGEQTHPEVIKSMQRAKLFLHPSSYEGFGIVCIEALYSGCKVISFVKPMNQEIRNWDIVKNKQEMVSKALSILQDNSRDYQPVLPLTIEQSVENLSQLFSL